MVDAINEFMVEVQDRWEIRISRSGKILIEYAAVDATKFIIERSENDNVETAEEVEYIIQEYFSSLPEHLESYELPPIEEQLLDEDLMEIAEQFEQQRDTQYSEEAREYANKAVIGGVRTVMHGAAETATAEGEHVVDAGWIDRGCDWLYDQPITAKWA